MRAFGQTAKWKKEEGKTLAIKKGAFWPIARLQQLAKEGKEKKAPKRGARRPDYFDRHHRAGGVQRRPRRRGDGGGGTGLHGWVACFSMLAF